MEVNFPFVNFFELTFLYERIKAFELCFEKKQASNRVPDTHCLKHTSVEIRRGVATLALPELIIIELYCYFPVSYVFSIARRL